MKRQRIFRTNFEQQRHSLMTWLLMPINLANNIYIDNGANKVVRYITCML